MFKPLCAYIIIGVQKLAIGLIFIYKYFISPYIPNCCVFNPSCSEYTKIQITQHGVIVGIYKGGIRLLRCHPFSRHDNKY